MYGTYDANAATERWAQSTRKMEEGEEVLVSETRAARGHDADGGADEVGRLASPRSS